MTAVNVCYVDSGDARGGEQRSARLSDWRPDIPLVTPRTPRRSLGPPMVDYLRGVETASPRSRVVVLIPEVQPAGPWQEIFYSHRDAVLDLTIRRGTENVAVDPQPESVDMRGNPRRGELARSPCTRWLTCWRCSSRLSSRSRAAGSAWAPICSPCWPRRP